MHQIQTAERGVLLFPQMVKVLSPILRSIKLETAYMIFILPEEDPWRGLWGCDHGLDKAI